MTPPSDNESDEGPLKIGELFQGYQIIKLLGRGGYASVYHARREFIGRDVAIKISNRSVTREVFKRFQSEARFTHRLEHPNIVKVDDADMAGGHLYIVMELLRGQTFWDARKQHGKFTIPEALHLCAQVADGVEQAHRAGAIHRDLKPLNLFIVAGNRAVVLDFGIAKIPDDGDGSSTQRNIVHGTLKYMSRDQLMGRRLTQHSDIYALGVIFFELVTGRHPHIAENARPTEAELGCAIVSCAPATLGEVDPSIPSYVAELAERALSRDPEKQFASMADFAKAARECSARYVREFPHLSELRELWVPAPGESAIVRSAPPPDQELIATAVVAVIPPQSLRPTVRVQSGAGRPDPKQLASANDSRPQLASTPAPVGGGVSVPRQPGSVQRAQPAVRREFTLRRVVFFGAAVGLAIGIFTVARWQRTPAPSAPRATASVVPPENARIRAPSATPSVTPPTPTPAQTAESAKTAPVPSAVATRPLPRSAPQKARQAAPTDKKIADRINWYEDEPRRAKNPDPKRYPVHRPRHGRAQPRNATRGA